MAEALRMAFGEEPLPEGTPYRSLSERQRRVIDAMVAAPGAWQIAGGTFGNIILLVDGYGLPSSHAELAAWTTA
jgi:hypothetical protein